MENAKTQVAEHNNAWKGRGNLRNLVAELERQKSTRADFVSDVRNLRVFVQRDEKNKGTVARLHAANEKAGEWITSPLAFNGPALTQLAAKCEPAIPKRFFDSLLVDRPERLESLINGLHDDSGAKRLVRCLDGKVRGWLSDSYRVIDNYDVAFTCMDAAQRNAGEIIEANLSDTAMRIKFTSRSVWDVLDVKQRSGPQGGWFAGAIGNKELQGKTILGARVSDELPGGPGTVHPVITVSNSETGHGGFRVRLGILMGICYNVATLEDVVTQIHLGEKLQEGIFTAQTVEADAKAIMLKARDAVLAAFDKEKFGSIVAKCRRSQALVLDKPTAAVDNVIEGFGISSENREALLEYFLRDYDQTAFGLAQAVSRLAQDTDDADAADELEGVAGKLILAAA